MATINQIRHLLRHLDVSVKRKKGGKYPFTYRKTDFTVKESDVDRYLQLKENLSSPKETSISADYYYEHVVDFQGFRGMPSRFRMGREEALVVENKEKTEKISLTTIFSTSLTRRSKIKTS